MIELEFQEITWCGPADRATLVLRTRARDRLLAVAATADDARAVGQATLAPGQSRAYELIELAVAHLEAVLTAVELALTPGGELTALLNLDGPAGAVQLPAHFADGIVLARRNEVPLLTTAAVLARIPDAAPVAAPTAAVVPAAFRDFIDSLDLSGLDA